MAALRITGGLGYHRKPTAQVRARLEWTGSAAQHTAPLGVAWVFSNSRRGRAVGAHFPLLDTGPTSQQLVGFTRQSFTTFFWRRFEMDRRAGLVRFAATCVSFGLLGAASIGCGSSGPEGGYAPE